MSSDTTEQSEDELLNSSHAAHETVETVPLNRFAADDTQDEHETLPTQPLWRGHTQNGNTSRLTQPTQIIRRSPAPAVSSPSHPQVQVAASSPIPTPLPVRKQQGYLANAMAPAGTAFRKPFAPPQQPRPRPILLSDDEGPKYKGGSSDDEREDLRKNDIKTTTFQKRKPDADTIPESPAKSSGLFTSVLSGFRYEPAPRFKRAADVNASSYGNASKKPRQTAPSRPLPIAPNPTDDSDMDLDDIPDPNKRAKVRRLHAVMSGCSLRQCFNALDAKNWNYDDASEVLLLMSEAQPKKKKKKHVDLTGSDDELMRTPAGPEKTAPPAKQQAKVSQKSIAEKWNSTQQVRKLTTAPRKLDVFEEPPKQGRRLVRGRKDRSSPAAEEAPSTHMGKAIQVSDDDTEDDSGILLDPERLTAEDSLLKFFNTCTAADLADIAVIDPKIAEHILSKRPFNTVRAIQKVESPDLKTAKSKRRAGPLGERVVEKVGDMLTSYEAVDYLVRKCEALSKPLAAEMKSWGVKIDYSETGELDIVSFADSQRSCHDSGIGTPVSDEEKVPAPKNFFGQPKMMSDKFKMKDYQVVGMNWLNLLYKRKLNGILADDMGLGKTYQVVAFLSHLREIGESGPHLIVVPAATLENWLKEFHQFSPDLRVEAYYSTSPDERFDMRYQLDEEKEDINVIVTTYTLAKGKEDFPWLKEYGFKCTIFDEGHVLKNADSQVSKKLIRIRSKFRLLLTGTPLQNNLKELISLLGFMMPDLFKEKEEDLQAIFTHKVKAMDENHEALLSAQRIARARSMLTPFILRRKKYQVLRDLPKKERRVELCDLTPEQAEVYQQWLQRALDIRERRDRGEEVGNESTHILMKLRQAAIHPMLFRRLYKDKQLPNIARQCTKDEQWQHSNPNLIVTELIAYSDMEIHTLCDNHNVLQRFALNDGEWLASGKVQKMLELLRKFMSEGHRTLIFSQFVMVLDILELVLEREAIAYFRLDGSTKVSERQDLIDEFSADDNQTPVFMLSTKAGGAGINLAKANKVILFDSGFNPQDDVQAENRAHRIGQVKEVEVVRLVSKGTVEEQIFAMGETKLKLDERVAGVGSGQEEESEGKKGKSDLETTREQEGRKMVEDIFFSKLKNEGERVKEQAMSPVKIKKEQSSQKKSAKGRKRSASPRKSQKSEGGSQKTFKAEEGDSQKTLTEKTRGVSVKDNDDDDGGGSDDGWEATEMDGVGLEHDGELPARARKGRKAMK